MDKYIHVKGKQPETCPNCGSPKVIGITYGRPTKQASEAVSRGELTLGGCFIDILELKDGSSFITNPFWRCNDCYKEITTPLQSELIRQYALEQNEANEITQFNDRVIAPMMATFANLQMYVRDVNLPEEIASKYTWGQILCERAFVDMTAYILGMVTTHRFAILSNHVADTSQTNEQTAAWGLHVANRDSYFRVIDKYEYRGKEQILLLHLPDADWQPATDYKQLFTSREILLYLELVTASRKRFSETCRLVPIPELTSSEWLERLVSPIGFDDDGNQFDLYS
jgi:hypothetical protein